MRPLSATEAFTPALDHTKALLRPFSLRLWLKLGFVAILAEMGGQTFVPPLGGNFNQAHDSQHFVASTAFTAGIVTIVVVAMVAAIAVWLLLFYFGSRMQLVLMDLVATRTTLVSPAWRRTAARTWRWVTLKFVCCLVVFIAMGVLFAGPIFLFVRFLSQNGQQPEAPAAIGSIIAFVFAFLVVIFIIVALTWLMRDIMLPFVLFQDAPFGEAISRTVQMVRTEPGPVCFYLFMKFVITLAAGIMAELCILFAVIACAIPTGGIGVALWFALRHSSSAGTIMMYISFGLLGLIFLTGVIAAIVCIGGATMVFYQAYALYFVGGRIPEVGYLLEPPPPQDFVPAPPPPFAPA